MGVGCPGRLLVVQKKAFMLEQIEWKAERIQLGGLRGAVARPVNAAPTHCLLLCHGFGAPGDDLLGLAGEIVSEAEPRGVLPFMVFPEAPIDLADEGMPGGRAWWRLNMMRLMQATMSGSFDELRDEVPEGIDEARELLVEAIVD